MMKKPYNTKHNSTKSATFEFTQTLKPEITLAASHKPTMKAARETKDAPENPKSQLWELSKMKTPKNTTQC